MSKIYIKHNKKVLTEKILKPYLQTYPHKITHTLVGNMDELNMKTMSPLIKSHDEKFNVMLEDIQVYPTIITYRNFIDKVIVRVNNELDLYDGIRHTGKYDVLKQYVKDGFKVKVIIPTTDKNVYEIGMISFHLKSVGVTDIHLEALSGSSEQGVLHHYGRYRDYVRVFKARYTSDMSEVFTNTKEWSDELCQPSLSDYHDLVLLPNGDIYICDKNIGKKKYKIGNSLSDSVSYVLKRKSSIMRDLRVKFNKSDVTNQCEFCRNMLG